nr:uncharacterized protein LOC113806432 [Penaeus vannamei]
MQLGCLSRRVLTRIGRFWSSVRRHEDVILRDRHSCTTHPVLTSEKQCCLSSAEHMRAVAKLRPQSRCGRSSVRCLYSPSLLWEVQGVKEEMQRELEEKLRGLQLLLGFILELTHLRISKHESATTQRLLRGLRQVL